MHNSSELFWICNILRLRQVCTCMKLIYNMLCRFIVIISMQIDIILPYVLFFGDQMQIIFLCTSVRIYAPWCIWCYILFQETNFYFITIKWQMQPYRNFKRTAALLSHCFEFILKTKFIYIPSVRWCTIRWTLRGCVCVCACA